MEHLGAFIYPQSEDSEEVAKHRAWVLGQAGFEGFAQGVVYLQRGVEQGLVELGEFEAEEAGLGEVQQAAVVLDVKAGGGGEFGEREEEEDGTEMYEGKMEEQEMELQASDWEEGEVR
jgi:hypothetical protein